MTSSGHLVPRARIRATDNTSIILRTSSTGSKPVAKLRLAALGVIFWVFIALQTAADPVKMVGSRTRARTSALNRRALLPLNVSPSSKSVSPIAVLASPQPSTSESYAPTLPTYAPIRERSHALDAPVKAPGLTDEEFRETWLGMPDTLKIGVLLPFTDADNGYRTVISRINLSVLRLAIQDMNEKQIVPGMNLSLVVRDSQQAGPGTGNGGTGGAAAIMATTRLLALGVGGMVGDIASELTEAEALMTSSVGVPQCSFSTYSMDIDRLASYAYLFRSVPGVMSFLEAIVEVIKFYKWKRISILFTSDIPGLLGEKTFMSLCEESGIDVLKVPISQNMGGGYDASMVQAALKATKNSDTRIHVLIAARKNQIELLDSIRNIGLFSKEHVWLTPIDLSNSIGKLPRSSDFNGLIMTDALWDLPGNPQYEEFLRKWTSLDPMRYPSSGDPRLGWHETFAYTCIQVMAEAYRGLVLTTLENPNKTERTEKLWEIKHGRRSQELTMQYLGNRTYDTPAGLFSLTPQGRPRFRHIDISSFQNGSGVSHGQIVNGKLSFRSPIVFNDGTTNRPRYAPDWNELNPSNHSAFGLLMIVLTTILLVAMLATAVVVVLNRDNIIIKSASPLFCILELVGLSLNLAWIYLRMDIPSDGTCRTGLMLLMLGLTLNLSALVVKNYRIYRIFNSVSVINHAVSNKYLLRVVSIPVLITLIPSIIHCFVDRLEPTLIRVNNNEFWVVCASDASQYIWDFAVGITPLCLNIFGIYLAFKTRNVTRLWNEARAIAITIYMASFFVIIIIIVQTFPQAIYRVTYHVTLVCVFVGCFLEYLILFYPKLRNLWLQKRGLHVPAGRENDFMDSILGGISAAVGRRGGISGADMISQDPYPSGVEKLHPGMLTPAGRGSVASDFHHQQQPLPNISDLLSSYPLGQIYGDNTFSTSPLHRPTIYGQSSLTNRAKPATQGTLSTQANNPPSNSDYSPPGALSKKRASYDIFGGRQASRTSRDAQPYDLQEILQASSNMASTRADEVHGFLSVQPPPNQENAAVGGGTARGYTRFINQPDMELNPIGARPFQGLQAQRSPKLYPLDQGLAPSGQGSIRSYNQPLKETRMDSYTVIVPVQRHRWYILRVLSQWRMSKVIFVPNSKVLVIVDLETEKSQSLIIHSIEPGYSPKDMPMNSQVLGNDLFSNLSGELDFTLTSNHSTEQAGVVSQTLARGAAELRSPEPSHTAAVEPEATSPPMDGPLHSQTLPSALSRADNTRPPNLRRGSVPIIRSMSRHLGLEARNMDGLGDRPAEDGIEQGIIGDFIVRVVSIHNESYRVQLPDQETMKRWIEIGQQIKDDNWLTSRPPAGGHGAAQPRSRSQSTDGPPTWGRGGGAGHADDFALGEYSHSQLRPRPRPLSTPQTRVFHPLQYQPDSYFPSLFGSAAADMDPTVRNRVFSDVTETSASSSEAERERSRRQAAKMNKQLRGPSRFSRLRKLKATPSPVNEVPPSSVLHANSANLQPGRYFTDRGRNRLSVNSATTVRSDPATSSSPSPPQQSRFNVGSPREIVGDGGGDGVGVGGGDGSCHKDGLGQELNESQGPTGGHVRYSPTFGSGMPSKGNNAHLMDFLAETDHGVVYDQGNHAVYESSPLGQTSPGHFRPPLRNRFNTLQYNYERRQQQHLQQQQHQQMQQQYHLGRQGDLLEEEDPNLRPESPVWHLTSSDLAKMDSDYTLVGSVASSSQDQNNRGEDNEMSGVGFASAGGDGGGSGGSGGGGGGGFVRGRIPELSLTRPSLNLGHPFQHAFSSQSVVPGPRGDEGEQEEEEDFVPGTHSKSSPSVMELPPALVTFETPQPQPQQEQDGID